MSSTVYVSSLFYAFTKYSYVYLMSLCVFCLLISQQPVRAQSSGNGWVFDHIHEVEDSNFYYAGHSHIDNNDYTYPDIYDWSDEDDTSQSPFSGQYTAVYRWTGPPCKTPPPLVLTINAYAYSGTDDVLTNPKPTVVAMDGFGDIPTLIPGNTQGAYGNHWYVSMISQGRHTVTKQFRGPVQTGDTLALDPIIMNASGTGINSDSFVGRELDFPLFPNVVMQGWSTACAPALSGTAPANWNSYSPTYFSGTGCQAQGTVTLASGSGNYITHSQLYISGTLVKEYWDKNAPGCPSPVPTDGSVATGTHLSSASLAALFDSTRFIDMSIITLQLKVWDSSGGYYEGSTQGPAYNKAEALCNNNIAHDFDISSGLPNVVAQALYCYTTTQSNSMQKNDILASLPALTTFYISTHGNAGVFGDCDATFSSSPYFLLYALNDPTSSQGGIDITTEISRKSPSQPPYGFVFIDGCETGSNDALATAFGIASSTQDRGFLGWLDSYYIDDDHVNWTTCFMENMCNGFTLRDAVINADINGPVNGTYNSSLPQNGVPAVPIIKGDSKMTIHGVYGNSTTHGGAAASRYDWFRPL